MEMVNRAHRDQRGLVGKFMIVWLLLLAVIVLVGYDAVSIAITTFKVGRGRPGRERRGRGVPA